jgi:hypothetical protein
VVVVVVMVVETKGTRRRVRTDWSNGVKSSWWWLALVALPVSDLEANVQESESQ